MLQRLETEHCRNGKLIARSQPEMQRTRLSNRKHSASYCGHGLTIWPTSSHQSSGGLVVELWPPCQESIGGRPTDRPLTDHPPRRATGLPPARPPSIGPASGDLIINGSM